MPGAGIARLAFDARRPIATSVASHAIESRQPVVVRDAPSDARIDQELRAKVGDKSLVCVPLFRGSEVVGTLNVMSSSEDERLTDDDGETLGMLSVVLSAAVSRAAELDARHAEAQALGRFRTLFDGAAIGIVRLDSDGRIAEANPALEGLLGATADELVGRRFADHVLAEHRPALEGRLAQMMSGAIESFELEACCQPPSGELVWSRVRAVLEPAPNGSRPRGGRNDRGHHQAQTR